MSNQTVSVLRTREDRVIPAAGVYEIDGAHTSVEFVARHLMITKVRGRFTEFEGQIVIGDDPEASSVEVTIQTASVSTADENRDGHLRGADFLDAEKYPTITFRSTDVSFNCSAPICTRLPSLPILRRSLLRSRAGFSAEKCRCFRQTNEGVGRKAT